MSSAFIIIDAQIKIELSRPDRLTIYCLGQVCTIDANKVLNFQHVHNLVAESVKEQKPLPFVLPIHPRPPSLTDLKALEKYNTPKEQSNE